MYMDTIERFWLSRTYHDHPGTEARKNEAIELLTAEVHEAGRRMQQWLLDVTPDL